MSDTTQGADAPNDTALFNEAVAPETTLAEFENPKLPVEPVKPAPPADKDKPEDKTKADDTAPVPAGRLREEAEARRKAERDRDALQARIDALMRQAPQQQAPQQQQKPDLFENPQGFVQAELQPFLEQLRNDFQTQREAMSLDWALRTHGNDKVSAARGALEQGMQRGDQGVWAIYNNAMKSHDPYGVIVRWHQEGETLRAIGGDLDGYRKRVLEEAMTDPEYRKRVIESAKGQAQATNNSVARPVVTSSPSLANIGAGGGDREIIEPSDTDLFRQATSARRRG